MKLKGELYGLGAMNHAIHTKRDSEIICVIKPTLGEEIEIIRFEVSNNFISSRLHLEKVVAAGLEKVK
jgi:hypothetical protein